MDGSIDADALRSIVTAQLEVESPQKPAGSLHPTSPASAEGRAAGRARALLRARARAEATYGRLVAAVGSAGELDPERSERALLLATCMLCRRLTPDEALDLIAQLPSMLQPRLEQCLDGLDRAVTDQTITDELERTLGLDAERARAAMRAVFKVIAETVAPGQIENVRDQLPDEMKDLFPSPRQ